MVEFACPGCGRRIRLVPHGQGRYAPPGEPPPPPSSDDDRRPPWARGEPPEETDVGTRWVEAPRPPDPPSAEPPPRRPRTTPPPADPPPARPGPGVPSVARALALLGLAPEADRAAIERAFHERSLLCHPDKVAHLDEDFQELADRKFRELKAAYDLLTGGARPSPNS